MDGLPCRQKALQPTLIPGRIPPVALDIHRDNHLRQRRRLFRQAIYMADNAGGTNTIDFDIPGSGPQVITPAIRASTDHQSHDH